MAEVAVASIVRRFTLRFGDAHEISTPGVSTRPKTLPRLQFLLRDT